MVPRSAPIGILKKVRKHVNANDSILKHFGVTWSTFVDFGDASNSRGMPKTDQRIECGYFLAPKGAWKAYKSGFRRGSENQLKF